MPKLIETTNYFQNIKFDNTPEKIVEVFITRKNFGASYLSLFTFILLLEIFLNKLSAILNFFSFLETNNMSIFIQNSIRLYSLSDIIALIVAIIGFLVAYFYFCYTILYVWDDPERKGGKQIKAIFFLQSLFSNIYLPLILLIYLFFVKSNLGEFYVVFFIVIVTGYYSNKIVQNYQKIMEDFTALTLLYEFSINKGSILEPMPSSWFFNKFDIRQLSVNLSFLSSFVILIFGLIFSFNILSILIMELSIILFFINSAYTNRIPILMTLFMESGDKIIAFIIDESPQYYKCILKGNNQEFIRKDLFKKMIVNN
jgi:hypothetical protein